VNIRTKGNESLCSTIPIETKNLPAEMCAAIYKMIESAVRYATHLAMMDVELNQARMRMGGDALREKTASLRSTRNIIYDGLITNMKIACRLYYQHTGKPLAEIVDQIDLENRHQIGHWAVEGAHELAFSRLEW